MKFRGESVRCIKKSYIAAICIYKSHTIKDVVKDYYWATK